MTPEPGTAPGYRRIVAKFGTNLLTSGGERLDSAILGSLVSQVAALRRAGVEMLVVTSGAIAAGRDVLGGEGKRKDIPYKQMLAAVGQGRLMQQYSELFAGHGLHVAQALITKGDLDNREGYLNVRNTLEGLLELGIVPIINENDVVDIREIGGAVFGDNDRLSAAVANLVAADLLAILSDIDGLFTADPRTDAAARLIPRVERIDAAIVALAGGVGSQRGRGGMAAKVDAAKMATDSGIPVIVANGHAANVLMRVAGGEAIGTLFAPARSKVGSRRRWMVAGLSTHGAIVVDDGAARALAAQNKSLLPAGVQAVEGAFARGDLVEIRDARGTRLGRGLTNYSAADLEKIKGARSTDIGRLLGYAYGDEVVHRNDLVLLTEQGAAAGQAAAMPCGDKATM